MKPKIRTRGESSTAKGRRWKRFTILAVALALALLLVEGVAWLTSTVGWVEIPRPAHSNIEFWGARRDTLGVWHHPDTSAEHETDCFRVQYSTNSIGARDRERNPRASDGRVVVLGDSYIEGWGLPVQQRFTDLLEQMTRQEHLNLGMAHFGPYQYLLAYREFGGAFEHQFVMVGVHPDNDFKDLDYEIARRTPTNDYSHRPFLVGGYPDYTQVVFEESGWRRMLRRNSYAFNALTLAAYRLRQRSGSPYAPPSRHSSGLFHSYYYDFTDAQFDLLRYSVERIVEQAGDRRVAVVLIPAHRDFLRFHQSGPPPLTDRLRRVLPSGRVHVLDLLSAMYGSSGEWNRYFFGCDPHWSPLGSAVAARATRVGLSGFFYPPAANPVAPTGER